MDTNVKFQDARDFTSGCFSVPEETLLKFSSSASGPWPHIYGTIVQVSDNGDLIAVVDDIRDLSDKRIVLNQRSLKAAKIQWTKKMGANLYYVGISTSAF